MEAPMPSKCVVAVLTLLAALRAEPVQAQSVDPSKAALAWTLPWDADWVTAVCFLGPGRVAAGNNLGQILVWDLPDKAGGPTPPPVRRLDGHTNTVNRLVATPDGRWLISASNDHTLRCWDLQAESTGSEALVLNAERIADASSPAGRRAGKKAPPPLRATVALQKAAGILTGHGDWVLGLALGRDGNTLVSGDDKGEVIVWDRAAGKEVRRWKVKGWAWALALAPDAQTVFVSERIPLVFDSGRHAGLKLWDLRTGTAGRDLVKEVEKQVIAAAAFSPDGKLLAVGRGGEVDGPSGKVTLLDPASGKKVRELAPGHLYGVTDLAFSPDGTHLYSSGRDTTVRAWRVADGKLVKELGQPRGGQFKDWIHAIAVAPDGRWLAAADMAGQVQIWALAGK
jgi:WD40 repeat protein